jgi:hypothetical protein
MILVLLFSSVKQLTRTMEIKNLSAEPDGKLDSWILRDLNAERFVFLPVACLPCCLSSWVS